MKYHNILLARNGDFVALFRKEGKILKLWRHINRASYGYKTEIDCKNEKWTCNEVARIPKSYNLNNRKHLDIMLKCLGANGRDVKVRLIKAISYFNNKEVEVNEQYNPHDFDHWRDGY